MVMLQADGLFQKAISESAAWMFGPVSHLKESWYGRIPMIQFGEKLGTDLPALRSKSTAELMKALPPPMTRNEAADRGEAYMPVVDGWVIPDDPARLFQSGKFRHVALLAGTNADEGTLLGGPRVRTLAQLHKWAQDKVGSQRDTLLSLYPAATDADAYSAAVQAHGRSGFPVRNALRTARAAQANPQTFQYQFTRVNGVGRRIKWGSFHASEIAYVFETLPDSVYGTSPQLFGDFSVDADTYNEQDARLSEAMSKAWVAFAKTSSPNGPGLTPWPPFSASKESYMEFGDQIAAKENLHKMQIDFMSDYTEGLRAHGVTASGGN